MTRSIPLAGLLLLGACVKFGNEPPPSLLALDSAARVEPGKTRSSADSPTISVRVPSVPQELAVQRVPVQASDTSIAYVKDAQWVEPPARLFARLLSDTISARTGRIVVGAARGMVDPGAQLTGELRSFTIDAETREAVVTYDASLVRADSRVVANRRFEARVPVTAIEPQPVGRALNQAANQVATEVADWIGR
ncbi:ABC-type transport auxiliary lipoprotein family protein [Stakelama saccharophila]|uniref:ABC-type transport auxiliary lipoprotein family protein n=1 Tax=Stakelama saccharophila TaxID=3075605 RepID=A0ABZ0BCG0_9SPHN|nr:ABC-type transport auxiliary lipoprotein family protein [Stakelama sp. W311]WNO55079.1 ABC-type transport auxiliary lipoprotein family protein [Stakelama sp. W311]